MADSAKGILKFVTRVAKLLLLISRLFTGSNLYTYFLLSMIFYIIIGVVGIVYHAPVKQFFCDNPASLLVNETTCNVATCSDKLLMCGQSACWRYAINYTYLTKAKTTSQDLYNTRMQAAKDKECNDIIDDANSPVDMLSRIQAKQGTDNPLTDCQTYHCRVLKEIVRETSELGGQNNNGECPNTQNVKPQDIATSCPCKTDAEMIKDQTKFNTALTFCNLETSLSDAFFPVSSPTPDTTTTTAAPTPAPGGASSRRLAAKPDVPATSATLPPCGTSDVDNPLCEVTKRDGPAAETVLLTVQDVPSTAQLERRLQSTASATNDALPDYATSAWTNCRCYFQCIEGARFRDVTCTNDGGNCKQPKPETSEVCTCNHCSQCYVIVLQVVAYASFAQAFFCLIAFLAFQSISEYGEDDFSEIGCCFKIVGCFCRTTPWLVKSSVWLVMWMIVFLVAEVSLPNFQTDCTSSQALKIATVIIAIFWGVQLIYGITFKRFKETPPWLHYYPTGSFFKMLAAPIRSVGP